MPRKITGVLASLTALVLLNACDSDPGPTVATPPGATTTPVSAETGTLAFCVGVFPPLHTRAGDIVTVRFEVANRLFTPSAPVGTQLSVQVPAGRFRIIVKGQTELTGTVGRGQTQSGSVGDGCPT